MVRMTEAELVRAHGWAGTVTSRSRRMLLDLLEDGTLADASEPTVRAYLQQERHQARLLRTPNFGRRSLDELLAATADPVGDAEGEALALRARQEIRRQIAALRYGVERLERLLDA